MQDFFIFVLNKSKTSNNKSLKFFKYIDQFIMIIVFPQVTLSWIVEKLEVKKDSQKLVFHLSNIDFF